MVCIDIDPIDPWPDGHIYIYIIYIYICIYVCDYVPRGFESNAD